MSTQSEIKQGITYKTTQGLQVMNNETEIILRKGAIHKTELVIDKANSTAEFIELLEQILDTGEVTLESNHIHQDDFRTLYNYGFIRNEIKQGFTMLLVEDEHMMETVTSLVPNADVVRRSDFITDKEIDMISAEKNFLATDAFLKELQTKLDAYSSIYYISTLNERHAVQTVNKLMIQLDKNFSMALFDNENFMLFGVEPEVTGCYECLEKKVLSRIQNTAETYTPEDDFEVTPAELLVGLGLINKDMEQTEVNGMSMLMGSVLYFYFPNFEYAFDFNRRTILCNTCAGINQVNFDEQNAASVNITKELIQNEN